MDTFSSEWQEAALAELAAIVRDVVEPTRIASGTRYVGLEHLDGDGNFLNISEVASGDLASAKFRFDPDHILYGKLRPYLRKIARPDFNGICSTDILPIKPVSRQVSRDYLYHYLRLPQMVNLANTRTTGANLPRLSPTTLAEFPVRFPPLDEQRRIAAILDKADAIRRRRRQALAEIDNLLRATFLDMFGDPASNPHGFPVEPVESVLSRTRAGTQSGPFGSALKKEEYVTAGVPVWGIENVENNRFIPNPRLFITQEKFEELERYSVDEGDILISRAGTVGRMCIARGCGPASIISTNLVRVALDLSRMLPDFFVMLFTAFPDRLARLKSNKKDKAFTFLNPSTLRKIAIPVPPKDAQLAFLGCRERIMSNRDAQTALLEQADDLFHGLSQRAFRGEL